MLFVAATLSVGLIASTAPVLAAGRAPIALDAVPASASRPAATAKKILVVGDSVGLTLGGIQRWGTRNGITVHNAGALGCTLMDNDLVITYAGISRRPADMCRTHETWPVVLAKFRPDLVIALFGAWDVCNMSWDNGHTWSWAGQPVFDARYLTNMRSASNRLAADGAHVLWLTPPCFGPHPGDDNPKSPWYDPHRVTALTNMLHNVAKATHQSVSDVIHTAGCPVNYKTRPDGVHFSTAGANAMMPTLGSVIRHALTS